MKSLYWNTVTPLVQSSLKLMMSATIFEAFKKDFWDLHELLDKFSIDEMISLHAERYPYAHDQDMIRKNFTDFKIADSDFEPICLRGKHWELIKLDFIEALE